MKADSVKSHALLRRGFGTSVPFISIALLRHIAELPLRHVRAGPMHAS